MIWLDSAATSFQKPASVRFAVWKAMMTLSSPGRGGYASAMAAADTVFRCRSVLGDMFGVRDPERVIFTSSATHGLNIAIKSLVSSGERVVISGYEHNAVVRPLRALGADVRVAESPLFDSDAALKAFQKNLPGASAAICCHVSNVFGYVLPLKEIAGMCRREGVPLIVDASQSAGVLPLDLEAMGCAFVAMPGHKGLLGPQGTGVLLCGTEKVKTLLEGGTGSESESADMPQFLPDRLEPGTHNVPGIAGLLAGTEWIRKQGEDTICRHETAMRKRISERLRSDRRITLYETEDDRFQIGVLSLQVEGLDCETAADRLGRRGVAVRAGLHCAPQAHRTAGTFEKGTVRISVSPFTTDRDADQAADAILGLLDGKTDINK